MCLTSITLLTFLKLSTMPWEEQNQNITQSQITHNSVSDSSHSTGTYQWYRKWNLYIKWCTTSVSIPFLLFSSVFNTGYCRQKQRETLISNPHCVCLKDKVLVCWLITQDMEKCRLSKKDHNLSSMALLGNMICITVFLLHTVLYSNLLKNSLLHCTLSAEHYDNTKPEKSLLDTWMWKYTNNVTYRFYAPFFWNAYNFMKVIFLEERSKYGTF